MELSFSLNKDDRIVLHMRYFIHLDLIIILHMQAPLDALCTTCFCLAESDTRVSHYFGSSARVSIGGSVVECSPATRAARVRFPADASVFLLQGKLNWLLVDKLSQSW